MTTAEILPPPFALDVRVARSPLVGLRYGVDGRATDIDDVMAKLDEVRAGLLARREEVSSRLGPYEASRRAMMERLAVNRGEDLRQRLNEGLELHAELASIDEQLACIAERTTSLREQRTTLAELAASLTRIEGLHDAAIDSPGAAENQAVRQLFQLIRSDHDVSAHDILEGPMQLLSDAGFRTELVGRAVAVDAGEAAANAAGCRRSASAALDQLQRVVFRLHPELLAEEGLVPAVRRLVEDLGDASQGRVMVLGTPRRVSAAVEMAVFRIVQEAVANAVTHGRASVVEVVLLFQPQRVAVVVRDDGEGFDVSATEARLGRNRGLGLISMRQRAQIEGGHLEVRSVIGEGTEVKGNFPT